MDFLVTRTSAWLDVKPCDEAVREPYTRVDWLNKDDPAKVPFYAGRGTDWWYGKGSNHRVENGMCRREILDEGWFVTIENLDELLAFVEKYEGRIVLRSDEFAPEIEIYDTWRE